MLFRVFELLLITFISLALRSLLSDACVSKMIPGFLAIAPLLAADELLLFSTDVSGVETDVTRIDGAIPFVSVFVVFVSLITWLLFTLATTN